MDEERLISEYTLNVRTTHTARLMPALDQLLKDSSVDKREINGIAVSMGPGSFTGLRIGMAVAKGLASEEAKYVTGLQLVVDGGITSKFA